MATFKFMNSIKFVEVTDNDYVIEAGRACAYAHYDAADNAIVFEYNYGYDPEYELSGAYSSVWTYECSEEGVKAAIWEWLCTLSKFLTSDGRRLLGSWKLAEAA